MENSELVPPRRVFSTSNVCVLCGYYFVVTVIRPNGEKIEKKRFNKKLKLCDERVQAIREVILDFDHNINADNGVCVKCFRHVEKVVRLKDECTRLQEDMLSTYKKVKHLLLSVSHDLPPAPPTKKQVVTSPATKSQTKTATKNQTKTQHKQISIIELCQILKLPHTDDVLWIVKPALSEQQQFSTPLRALMPKPTQSQTGYFDAISAEILSQQHKDEGSGSEFQMFIRPSANSSMPNSEESNSQNEMRTAKDQANGAFTIKQEPVDTLNESDSFNDGNLHPGSRNSYSENMEASTCNYEQNYNEAPVDNLDSSWKKNCLQHLEDALRNTMSSMEDLGAEISAWVVIPANDQLSDIKHLGSRRGMDFIHTRPEIDLELQQFLKQKDDVSPSRTSLRQRESRKKRKISSSLHSDSSESSDDNSVSYEEERKLLIDACKDLINKKYAFAIGKSEAKFPYKLLKQRRKAWFTLSGFPDDLLPLRHPEEYDTESLNTILENHDQLRFTIHHQDDLRLDNDYVKGAMESSLQKRLSETPESCDTSKLSKEDQFTKDMEVFTKNIENEAMELKKSKEGSQQSKNLIMNDPADISKAKRQKIENDNFSGKPQKAHSVEIPEAKCQKVETQVPCPSQFSNILKQLAAQVSKQNSDKSQTNVAKGSNLCDNSLQGQTNSESVVGKVDNKNTTLLSQKGNHVYVSIPRKTNCELESRETFENIKTEPTMQNQNHSGFDGTSNHETLIQDRTSLYIDVAEELASSNNIPSMYLMPKEQIKQEPDSIETNLDSIATNSFGLTVLKDNFVNDNVMENVDIKVEPPDMH